MFSISRTPRLSVRTKIVATLAGLVLVAGPAILASAPAAQAAARVAVVNQFGKAEADLTYATKVSVKGKDFQSIKGGFGGIYVMFGAIYNNNWKPSKGGSTGNGDYEYVPDSEAKDNAGFQRFVAFPGSDTASSANGGILAADGSWSTELTIPGSTFEAADRDGKIHTVDCKVSRCGIITIGAHGVASAKNETFTPVKFASIFDAAPTPTPSSSPSPDAGTATPPKSSTAQTPAPSSGTTGDGVKAAVNVDRESAYPGRALTFTGTGFMEGEQVVAILDDGLVAVGPTVVGRGGGLAGIIALPPETTAGTHTIRLVAASSGRTATVSFPVRLDVAVAPTAVASATAAGSNWPTWLPSWPVLVVLVVTLAAFGAAVWLKFRKRFRKGKGAAGKSSHAPKRPTAKATQPTSAAAAESKL